MKARYLLCLLALIALRAPARAQEPATGDEEKGQTELEKARLEAEQARAVAEEAKAEAARAREEVEKLRLELRQKRARPKTVGQPFPPPPPRRKLRPVGPPLGFHTHDGFFMRFTLGPGFGWYNSTGHVRLLGTSLVLTNPQDSQLVFGGSFSLGGSISENFTLHFTTWGSGLNSVNGSPEIDELNQMVIGGGLTYYWMPENFFVSGVIGFASGEVWVEKRDDWYGHGDPDDTTRGLGLLVMGGKEWWVSANWGLGMALGLEYIYSEGRDISIRQLGLRLLFTATYN